MVLGGPAAGHALMKTAADPDGRRVLGTLGNCASGITPWGTYLTGEENWMFCFSASEEPMGHLKRWGLRKGPAARWQEFDERFDATKHPNEPNRFGWIVEIDPMDPTSTPVKRTALGRAAHEGATVTLTQDGRAVVYSGEDARFEYLYRFVSRDRMKPGGAAANASLLDHGTLFVARFDADGRGRWLPLVHGQGPLTPVNGFADQGEVLIKSRQASDALGARRWVTVTRVVLPAAIAGIVSGAMLAVARAAGETAPLLFTIGFSRKFNPRLDAQNTALPFQIWNNAQEPVRAAQDRAWGAALTLIVIVFVLTVVARIVAARFAVQER